MTELATGQDKIKSICKVLKEETLAPAKKEAQKILDEARAEAERIIRDAKADVEKLQEEARDKIQRERSVFESALSQAGKQGLESLRQDIERRLFNQELSQLVAEGTKDPQLVGKLIEAICDAIEREGVGAKLEAVVPKTASVDSINAVIGERVLSRLQDQSVQVGNFESGAQVKLVDRKMTIDITDAALKELLSNYVRKDFRKLLFQH